jgi:hypothetical protein
MSTLNVTNLKNEASASNNVTLDSNGRVGVGIAPNTSLHVKGNITVENTTNAPFISFVESGDNTDEKARIQMDQISGTAGQLIFYTENGGTIGERLRIQSAGGISFNGDTAAANALDDYEKGTWTPAFVNATSPSYSSTYTDGWYIKIGDFVMAGGVITTNSFTNTSAQMQITLPFQVGNNNREYGPVNLFPEFGNNYSPGEIMALLAPGTSRMQFYKMSASTSANYVEFQYVDVEDVGYRIRWTAVYGTD